MADVFTEALARLTEETHAITRRIDVMPEVALEEALSGWRAVPVCPAQGDTGGAWQTLSKCDKNPTIES